MQESKIKMWKLELKVYLLENINKKDCLTKITYFIDSVLKNNEKFLKYHNERVPKGYVLILFLSFRKRRILCRKNLHNTNKDSKQRIKRLSDGEFAE